MTRWFPPRSSRRTAALTAVVLAAAWLMAVSGLPRRTPDGVLFSGLVDGGATALLAAGLVLTYRSAHVINFAQVALGAAGPYLTWVLVAFFHWPLAVGLVVGLGAAAAVGVLFNVAFVQRFFDAPRLVLTVVTVVAASLLATTASWIDRIPNVKHAKFALENQRILAEGSLPLPFSGLHFTINPIRFGSAQVLALVLAGAALAGLAVFFTASRAGIAIRGAAENSDRAQLLGINVRLLSALVWTISAVLSALAALVIGLNHSFNGIGSPAPELLIAPLAAAVLARMESLPVAVAAGFGITAFEQAVFWSYPRSTTVPLALLGVIAVGLIVQRRRMTRSEDGPASSWAAIREIRPTPRELVAVDGVRRARRGIVVVAAGAAAILPIVLPTASVNLAALITIYGIVGLSLVVLTGWAGQISLGQFALVAVAAAIGGSLTSKVHLTFWLAIPLTAVFVGAFAALVGLPALRLRGVFLAVTTLAFAVATQQTLFGSTWLRWLIPDRVDRPRLFFISFADERNYYYLCLVTLGVCAMLVRRLRAGRPGRVLIGQRDNEAGVQSFGVDVIRIRLAAFALAGALCGVAGVLYVHHQRALDAGSYDAGRSVQMFVMVMIGGVSSVSGALLGATYLGVTSFLVTDPVVRQLTTGGALLALLVIAPGGLAQIAYGMRDGALRIVALRERIAVPSLFEDLDEATVAARKVVLAPRSPGHGIDNIPIARRYRLDSDLHGVHS